jgi:5-methylcytosine-specific restriction endonuclease McrA
MQAGIREMPKPRNYRKEYDKFQSSRKEKKNRAARNKARRQSGLKKGDKREIDHIKPLSKGGGNGKSNRRIVSRRTNRRKGKK